MRLARGRRTPERPLAAVQGVRDTLARTEREASRVWARAEMEAERLQSITRAEGDRLARHRMHELSAARDRISASAAEASTSLRLIADRLLGAAGEVATLADREVPRPIKQEE